MELSPPEEEKRSGTGDPNLRPRGRGATGVGAVP